MLAGVLWRMFRAWFLCFLSTLAHAQTCACTIPVFRYALDRWEPDRLTLRVPAFMAQKPEMMELLRPLRANGLANLDLKTVTDAALTVAELRDSKTGQQVVWSGNLDPSSLEKLLDSPARKLLLDRILSGQSVIWVLVDSGAAENQVQMDRIEQRLKFLQQVAALPIQDPNDPDSQLGPGPRLKLEFGTLRLKANDPAEQALIRLLAGPETDASAGFAAAVFGRGRVLGSWPLAKLDDAALEDACLYLVGRCSCRVKNQNPGWDLLLNVNWDKALKDAQAMGTALPPTAATTKIAPVEVVRTAATPGVTEPISSQTDPTGVPQSFILLASAGLLLVGVVLMLRKNKT